MRQANVIVTFGTSHPDAWARTLTPLIQETANVWPEIPVSTAVTSPSIRRILQSRGEQAQSLSQVLEKLEEERVEQVRLCATHLIRGREYVQLEVQAKEFRERFRQLLLSQPLLNSLEDQSHLSAALDRCFPSQEGWLTLFVAHGVKGGDAEMCLSLEYMCVQRARSDFRFAALHGAPTLEQVLPKLGLKGQVMLVPLMLTAGEHTKKDLFGEDSKSWFSQLIQAGIRVRPCRKGLGEFSQIRQLYLEHFQQAQYV